MKVLDEPVSPNEGDKPKLRLLEGVFKQVHKDNAKPKLVGPNGFEIELPESVFVALCQVIYHLMRGHAVSIIPINQEITTQEAADILNVSRPFLVKLLEQGEIPFVMVGSHRRIRIDDLLSYKRRRNEERKRGLAEIAQISQEAGLYD